MTDTPTVDPSTDDPPTDDPSHDEPPHDEPAPVDPTTGESSRREGGRADDGHQEFWQQSEADGRAERERTGIRHRARDSWDRFVDMPVEGYISLFVVAACVVFVFMQLQPDRIFTDTTPAGGDMGAHVWAPAYLRDHLLSQGRLTGWTQDWYAGFPAFQFYMIVPSLAIALLSFVIPYGVAFKLVAVSGCVSLPFSAWFFAKMARLPFPAPAVVSCGATLFLFDRSFSIYGGNIASTLAGEFAFSISLSFGLLYLGVLARGLETGRYRGWAALLLALTALSHLIPAVFVLVGTGVYLVLRPGKGQAVYVATMGVVGGALTAFWALPFYWQRGYMNDMGWEKITRYGNYLWSREKLDPQLTNVPNLQWVIAVAAVGLLLSLVYRRRAGVFLALMAGIFAAGFVLAPQGKLWNARLLPFYYLCLYLLAAVGVAELSRLLSALFAPNINRPLRIITWVTPVLAFCFVGVMLGMSLRVMPGGSTGSDGSYRWGIGPVAISTTDRSFIDSWAKWNFDGYEGYSVGADGRAVYNKSYPEYEALMATMAGVGQQRGCGRAMWEHEDQHDRYGTPMALMLLPFWTDGCIGSMEGLYFEASGTTPYHFLNQDELSWAPSNAQRDLPYTPGPPTQAELDLGVEHLQMTGVRYYLVINASTKALADQNRSLTAIQTSGPWTVYEVADAPLVQALTNQPAVLTGQSTKGREWQDIAVCWWENPASWDVVLTADGPDSWPRVSRTNRPDANEAPAAQCQPREDWGWFDDSGGPGVTSQPAVKVDNIVETDDGISFDVDRPGVPVLVKTSYFPNWKASGADGPYRATPNWMVVVPTGTHVELSYGYVTVDYAAYAITLIGLIGLIVLFRRLPVRVRPPRRFWGHAERPDLYPTEAPDLRFDDDYRATREAALAWIVPTVPPDGPAPPSAGPRSPGPADEAPGPPQDPTRPRDAEPDS